MSRIVTVQSNFTSGEVDPKLNARIDLQQYYNALDTAQNVTIQPQGGIKRRDGSEYIATLPTDVHHSIDMSQFHDDIQDAAVSGDETFDDSLKPVFKSDGTKMYIKLSDKAAGIAQFTLSTAWDVNTATLDGVSKDFATYGENEFIFSHDGAYLIVCDSDGSSGRSITSYTLNTAWDLTAGTSANTDLLGTTYYLVADIQINADGTKLFFIGNTSSSSAKNLYELSPSGSVYTSTYSIDEVQFVGSGNTYLNFDFVLDGTGIVINEKTGGSYTIRELTTAYDLTTYQSASESLLDQIDLPDYDSRQKVAPFYVKNNAQEVYYFDHLPSTQQLLSSKTNVTPKFKMVPFEFSVDDSYMLVFIAEKMFVFKNGAQINNITGTDDFLTISALKNDYVDSINFTQAADSLILCHEDMVPQFIQRGATDASWTVTDLSFDYIPKYAFAYDTHNPQFTITPSDVTGNITITASAVTTDTGTAQAGSANTITLKAASSYTTDDKPNGMFIRITSGTGSGQERHVEDYVASTKVLTVDLNWDTAPDNTSQYEVKAFKSAAVGEYINGLNGFGRARITEYVSDTEVKAYVEIPFFDTDALASGDWESEHGYEDVWSNTRGWPRSCVFHEGRLFLGGAKSRPSTLWGSRVADFFNFDPGEQLDDSALEATLDTGKFNAIVDLYSGRNLQIFTTGGEFYIPQTLGDPITPSTLSVKEQTSNGVKPGIPVVNIDGSTLFIQRQGKTLSEFLFNDSVAGYVSTRISLLSSHLLKTPSSLTVRKATSTDEGDRVLIVNDDDGSIACFTLLRSEQIVAPSEWTTDGSYLEVGVDIADVYIVVNRPTSSGTARYYVERFVEGLNTDCAKHATVSGSTSAVGMSYLPEETFDVISDGVVEDEQTPVSPFYTVTFANAATSSYEIGLPYTSTIKTLPFEGRLPSGPTRSFKKRILSITADLYETQALTIDGEAVTFDANANGLITPYTGFKRKGSLLGYNKDATITITQGEPLDMTILSLDYEVSTGQ